MTRQGIVKSLNYFIFFALIIKNAASVCKISSSPDVLSTNLPYGPLVYKYQNNGIPLASYPSVDSSCIFDSEDRRLHLACQGPNSTMQFYQTVGNATQVVNATSTSVYLLHDPSSTSSIRVRGGPSSFKVVSGNYVRCSTSPFAAMHLLKETNNSRWSEKRYTVGYALNDFDFLKVYEHTIYEKEMTVTEARIRSVIRNRPGFSESNVFEKGLFFQKARLNFTEIYSKEYQIAAFQQWFANVSLTEKYFADNNSLVAGQLIFKEDMFYYTEQKSTFYYENTVPIWKSVYEGNWRTIGSIIRKIADETDRDLDVFVVALPSFVIGLGDIPDPSGDLWALGNTANSPDLLPVPRILVKVAVDVENNDRGMVFHTFNNPHTGSDGLTSIKHCSKFADCKTLHPEFEVALKGYTYCCKPEDSYIFQRIKQLRS